MDLSPSRASRRQADVSKFAGLCGPDLAGEDGDDSKGVAIEGRELDFVSFGRFDPPFPAPQYRVLYCPHIVGEGLQRRLTYRGGVA